MKVTIRMSNGDEQEIEEMPDADVLALLDEFGNGEAAVFAFTLDGSGILHVARRHIVSILAEDGSP